MAIRFRKSIKIAPGVRLNIGKKGGSFTVGGRGSSVSIGSRGVYGNVGLPGTGLSYRSKIGGATSVPGRNVASNRSSSGSGYVQMAVSLALQKDSSVTFQDAHGNPLSDEYISQAKRQQREVIINWLQGNADDINGEIESLVNTHLATPSPETEIVFTPASYDEQAPEPPSPHFTDPQPSKPNLKEYDLLAKWVEVLRRRTDRANQELQKSYEDRIKRWEANKAAFEANYAVKHQKYLENIERYQKDEMAFKEEQEKRRRFVEEERLVDTAAMQEFLAEVLQSLIWPRETLISYEVVNDGQSVLLDVDLPEIEDMPEQQVRVNKRDLKLTYSDIPEVVKRRNYFTHIHAIGFRLIGEVFVALPSITSVVLSGYSQRSSKSTGKIVDEYLYSVRVLREKWEEIDFKNLHEVDVVVCFEQFELRRITTKTGVITPIEPF